MFEKGKIPNLKSEMREEYFNLLLKKNFISIVNIKRFVDFFYTTKP